MKGSSFDKTLENFQKATLDLSLIVKRRMLDAKKNSTPYDLKDLSQIAHLLARTVQLYIECAPFYEVKGRIEVLEQVKQDLPYLSEFTEEEREITSKVLTWMQEDALTKSGHYEPKRDQYVLPLGGV